jgi:hypothetical protein
MKTLQSIKTFKLFALFLLFFGCTTEEITNVNINAEGLGKVNIYIEGNITNAEAQAKLTAEIGTQTENIYVQETTQLTDLTINLRGNIRDINLVRNLDLKNLTINGNNVKANTIKIAEYDIYGNDPTDKKFENININGIVEVKNLYVQLGSTDNTIIFNCNDLINIKGYLIFIIYRTFSNTFGVTSFNKLKYINSEIRYIDYYSRMQGKYEILNLPALEEVYDIEFYTTIETLNLPKLKKINKLRSENVVPFQNLNLPQLERCEEIYLQASSTFGTTNQTLNFPIMTYCKKISLLNLYLDTNKVNAILHHFLNVNPTSGKTIIIKENNASPTGQGLIDKQTLINQGNIVNTN